MISQGFRSHLPLITGEQKIPLSRGSESFWPCSANVSLLLAANTTHVTVIKIATVPNYVRGGGGGLT